MTLTFRDLHSLEELRDVMGVERDVWHLPDDELVPASLLVVSVKCGGIVIGAYDGSRLVGFVYSFPGERHGRRLQWSHMLGVVPEYQRSGVGHRLKLLQRERALGQGLDVIEWTFDPLQAGNASFNFNKLGVVSREYLEDAYGQTPSPLHRGAATDRLVAQWWLRAPIAEQLVRAGVARPRAGAVAGRQPTARRGAAPTRARGAARSIAAAPRGIITNPVTRQGRWLRCSDRGWAQGAPALLVNVPPVFTTVLSEVPELARDWRETTRTIFQRAFNEGYVVTGFWSDDDGGGHYVLTRDSSSASL
jgi:predicted GNAT superfamily acetyltransferase